MADLEKKYGRGEKLEDFFKEEELETTGKTTVTEVKPGTGEPGTRTVTETKEVTRLPPKRPPRGTQRPEFCIGGRSGTDYRPLCPQGWTASKRYYGRRGCLAPTSYVPPAGCGNQLSERELSSEKRKQHVELNCMVKWPCKQASEAGGAGGEAEQGMYDYSVPCPEDWGYFTDGTCRAKKSYAGPCLKVVHLLGFTRDMKMRWSAMCNAEWPEITPEARESMRKKRERQTRMEGVRHAAWAGNCARDYHNECPSGWTLDSELHACTAPPGVGTSTFLGPVKTFVPGMSELCPNRMSLEGLSNDMKKALEEHCGVRWPCQGDVVLQSSFPVLALLGVEFGRVFL